MSQDNKNVVNFYNKFDEAPRLFVGLGQLEFVRTQEIIQRFIKKAPAVLLDIGGAAGVYSLWLAKLGYEVHLVDPVPRHIKQAEEENVKQSEHPIASLTVGDARKLHFKNDYADAVLLMGPLYHITERRGRLLALKESHRILKKNGVILAAAVSRFASVLDGLHRGFIDDPLFRKIIEQDLKNGQHRNPTDNQDYFTDTFFHHSDELKQELTEASFKNAVVLPVEGIGWVPQDFDERWNDPEKRRYLIDAVRSTENEPSILGLSPHLMGVGWKKLS